MGESAGVGRHQRLGDLAQPGLHLSHAVAGGQTDRKVGEDQVARLFGQLHVQRHHRPGQIQPVEQLQAGVDLGRAQARIEIANHHSLPGGRLKGAPAALLRIQGFFQVQA